MKMNNFKGTICCLFFLMQNIYAAEAVFTQIFLQNIWAGKESPSGTGSSLDQTVIVRAQLGKIIKEHNIKSILDLPCGDFNWMKYVDSKDILYIGADIVKPLIDRNQKLYANNYRKFVHLNAVNDPLPEVDLIICRDLLVHLSYQDCVKVIKNFKKSRSKYLLITTFTSPRPYIDILTGGSWRPLNMQAPPFNFKAPCVLVNEHCTEVNGIYGDKCLGLWYLKDISIN